MLSAFPWLNDVAWFFGGAFLVNAIPHFVSGVMGQPFQSPFARPPGQGLSSSTVNVLWGAFNLLIAYLLLAKVGNFNPRLVMDMAVAALGALAMALMSARLFGRFHGGSAPGKS